MEGKKQVGSSSSSYSLATDLFGPKDSSSNSGIFASIFGPSAKVLGRESIRGEVVSRKLYTSPYEPRKSTISDIFKNNHGESSQSTSVWDPTTDQYQYQRVQQPCHLSSSIYYGGQDIYHIPEDRAKKLFKQDLYDDTEYASRGNWWQGSLYY